MRIGWTIIGLLWLTVPGLAQLKTTLHKVFEVPEAANQLVFNIYEQDSFDVVPWAGNTLMVETHVAVERASRGVFDYLIEEGRYDVLTEPMGDSLLVSSNDLLRQTVRVQGVASIESVYSRIFIPDTFEPFSANIWKRPEQPGEDGQEPPRKKLNREKMDVDESVKEAVQPTIDTSSAGAEAPTVKDRDKHD